MPDEGSHSATNTISHHCISNTLPDSYANWSTNKLSNRATYSEAIPCSNAMPNDPTNSISDDSTSHGNTDRRTDESSDWCSI